MKHRVSAGFIGVVLFVGLSLFGLPGVASARSTLDLAAAPQRAAAATNAGDPAQGKVRVTLSINRFATRGSRTIAKGTATARLLDFAGRATTITQPVTLTVKRGASC